MDQILHMGPSPHMDLIPHVDQIPQKDQSPHMNIIVLTLLFCREDLRVTNMCIILEIIMFIIPRRITLLIHMLTLTLPMLSEMVWHLCHLSHMVLAG